MTDVLDEEYFINNFARLQSLVDYVLEGLGDGSLDEASIDDPVKIAKIRILGVGIVESEKAESLDESLQTFLKNHGGLTNFATQPIYKLSPLISAILFATYTSGECCDFSNMGAHAAFKILKNPCSVKFQWRPKHMTDLRVHIFRKFCRTSNNEVIRMIDGNIRRADLGKYIANEIINIDESLYDFIEAAVKRHKVRQIPGESPSPKLISHGPLQKCNLQFERDRLQTIINSNDEELSCRDEIEHQQENIETAVNDNSIVDKEDVYFWDILERENDVKIPEYMKNLLRFENLDNPRSFKNINDDTFREIQEFLRHDMHPLFKNDFNLEQFYGRYIQKPHQFRFSTGDRYLIHELQKFVACMPDDFWSNYNLKPFPLYIGYHK